MCFNNKPVIPQSTYQYMQFPKFLLEMDLPFLAMIVYTVLLDRTRLSIKNGWADERGNVYCWFPIAELAKAVNRKQSAVKVALNDLREKGLVRTEHAGLGKPNRIYIYTPDISETGKVVRGPDQDHRQPDRQNTDSPRVGKTAVGQSDSRPIEGQKSVPQTDENTSTSNTNSSNNYLITKRGVSEPIPPSQAKKMYGIYNNVLLSDEDYAMLEKTVKDTELYINKLSTYILSKSVTYDNHAATIIRWALEDNAVLSTNDKHTSYDEEDYL